MNVFAPRIRIRLRIRLALYALLLACYGLATLSLASDGVRAEIPSASARDRLPQHALHTSHEFFFNKPFLNGPDVTRACLQCHPDSASEVMQTAHWNWQGEVTPVPGHEGGLRIGKRNLINNFCIGVQSNWPACTMCHIGYGWEDETFDFNDPSKVDCLVCHDNSGTYQKKIRGAGMPDESVDLNLAARSVGLPRRQNCGSCHFAGGGGNAVKHGDLDGTLLFPDERIDVHMGKLDMQCIDCHRTERHRIKGRSMSVSVDSANRVECTDCHAVTPHSDTRLNAHTARVACQACHIPHMSADTGTKMSWDWSAAGQDLDITDSHQYLKIKGRFTWVKKMQPEYRWYNNTSSRYIAGDKIDPAISTALSAPLGSRDDPQAKIWPFKVHRGKQPYDTQNNYFLVPNVHGEQGFWSMFDWKTALQKGSQLSGLPYSGTYDFAPTEMYIPLSHMVAHSDEALQCRDCHGERGRFDWVALGYSSDPLGRVSTTHDPVYMTDADGEPVTVSGQPLSITQTCGLCHELDDAQFIATHAYHSSVQDEQLLPERRQLMRDGPRLPLHYGEQMNCFLCHLQQPDVAGRRAAIDAGKAEWSVSATLLSNGLLMSTDDGYEWNTARIGNDGEAELDLQPVAEANCGACHGVVDNSSDPLLVTLGTGEAWTTETTGQVFSPQAIRQSAMNHANKDALGMPWDVHAARMVSCGDCHYSSDRPQRLAGTATEANVNASQGIRRRCESCHALDNTHSWLPQTARHFNAVACESCHVPRLEMGARETIDHTVMQPDGSLLIRYRGIDDTRLEAMSEAFITGYEPLLQVGRNALGQLQVQPYNLVTEWFWSDADSAQPVSESQLRTAWLDAEHYPPEVMQVFDANADAQLDQQELRLDSEAKLALISQRLRSAGVHAPRLSGAVRAYHIHHNIRHGEDVNRDCNVCHQATKNAATGFELAPAVPAGLTAQQIQNNTGMLLDGSMQTAEDGSLQLMPTRSVAQSWQAQTQNARSEP